ARSRIGEGGYDIIHNNCEHFAYECLFGVGRSLQEEELRKKWQSRPFLDVYVALIPDTLELSPVFPTERQVEIERVNNARSKREKYAVWRLLEKALSRSLGLGIEELSFKKRRDGKWTADGIEFSLTHSKGACAVAVSSRPVGIDIENADDFISRYSDGDKLRSLSRRVSTVSELKEAADPEAFLRLWTKKEAIFKLSGKGSFFPHKIDAAKTPAETRLVCLPAAYSVSVAGERLDKRRFYRVTDNGAHQMSADEMK
ncbi:MAG: 4'-phosphopantetheinyl transferase superfamily protein, partial [Oscillospiraceae bacterium]|nr:4'-phosphopantetheinyl transferase superfamily protein [Oscillospiraceae bacterium]